MNSTTRMFSSLNVHTLTDVTFDWSTSERKTRRKQNALSDNKNQNFLMTKYTTLNGCLRVNVCLLCAHKCTHHFCCEVKCKYPVIDVVKAINLKPAFRQMSDFSKHDIAKQTISILLNKCTRRRALLFVEV